MPRTPLEACAYGARFAVNRSTFFLDPPLTFEFTFLELICTSEFFKKLKMHGLLRQVQFQLFEKLTSAN